MARKAHRELNSVRSLRIGTNHRLSPPHSFICSGQHIWVVRWTSNEFGAVTSRFDILRAATPGQRYSTVPWVKPGGDVLLRLAGWSKVECVLKMVDVVEALDIHPADVAPDYWHHVHNRVSVNETPRSYTRARHHAWLRRRKIAP